MLKKAGRLSSKAGRARTKEKVKIINELRHDYGFKLRALLELAELAKSTYFENVKSNDKEDKNAFLKEKITHYFNKHRGRYGYRRIMVAMNSDSEVKERYGKLNHKRIKRLMDLLGLKAKIRVKKYKSYRGQEGKIAPNLFDRDFSTQCLEEKAVTDITEFKVCGKKIYLSPLIDLHSKEVLGFSHSFSPTVDFVIEMLENALQESRYNNLTIHTDQGFQYQNAKYQTWLNEKGITQSMSRKGNCYDNAVAENFFSHLKAEFYHVNEFETVDEFIEGLVEYIHYYNNERIVSKLKMPPVSYREQCLANI